MNNDEQVSKNLELVGRFFEHLLDHPSELDAQPGGLTVILVPDDDEELAEANLAMARSLMLKDAASRTTAGVPDHEDAGGILLRPVHP